MIGDSNARLGKYSQDRDIHGNLISNKNKPLFLGFLSYSQMTYMNGLFARGIPTYEIFGQRRSIIDVCLTNTVWSVVNFAVLPNVLGANPQTSHRVLQLVVSETVKTSKIEIPKVRKFRYCSYDALCKIQFEVAERISQLIILRN